MRAAREEGSLGESAETVRVTYPGSLLSLDRVRFESPQADNKEESEHRDDRTLRFPELPVRLGPSAAKNMSRRQLAPYDRSGFILSRGRSGLGSSRVSSSTTNAQTSSPSSVLSSRRVAFRCVSLHRASWSSVSAYGFSLLITDCHARKDIRYTF